MTVPWSGAFEGYAAQHSEVGGAEGPIAYLPPDFVTAAQVSRSHVLLWDGDSVVAVPRSTADNLPDPDLGTGQQLKDYLPAWDRPDAEVMTSQGVTQLMVWSVKNALKRGGFSLKFPAPPGSEAGWKVYPAGFPVPPDWRGG